MITIGTIKANPSNPRVTKDDKYKKLVNSIREFPKMMALRPMVVDSNGMVLGGNHRLRALQELGYKEIPEDWVKYADELTEEEKERFIITDNLSAADWDFDILQSEWDVEKLEEWGVDLPEWGEEIQEKEQVDLSSTIENLYRIEIICKDEEHQENIYNKLIEQGYECRLLTL